MMFAGVENLMGSHVELVGDRFRALLWRQRGAVLGMKSRVGARCVIQRPSSLEAGTRCQLEHEVFIKITQDLARIELGAEVFLGRGVELDIAYGLSVGKQTLIAPGCFITDHSHKCAAGASIASQGCEGAPVRIGSDVWLGAKSVVLAGVTIGDGAIVAAGAVVNRDVASMSIVAGVPARVVGQRS